MKFVRWFGVLLVAGVSFTIGSAYEQRQHTSEHSNLCSEEYTFINHDIVCGRPDAIEKTGYGALQERLEAKIVDARKRGQVAEVSMYFRDLHHGPVFGINEIADFAPASLLKLPLSFVFFAAAEAQPALLDKNIQYNGTTTVAQQRIQPGETALPETPYPIRDLLRRMLTHSDNASYEALEAFLLNDANRTSIRHEVFQEIGLINPNDRIEETITVRGYASLFRILYNASYLKEEYSEQILKWLAESPLQSGIKTGVPTNVLVAHKFGERFTEDGQKQFHDCGIVYFPENPYLLCIMTRGNEWRSLEELIGELSEMVYKEVDSRRL